MRKGKSNESQSMNMLSLLDRVADQNWWFAATTIAVSLIWIVVRRLLRSGAVLTLPPQAIAFVDLLLTPLVLICLGSLVRTGLDRLDVADLGENVRFLAHLGAFLSIAWFFARLVELWILSRSRNDIGTHLLGLERGLLFGGVLFLGLIAFLAAKGYSITGLYVSTGAVAAVIAFAMQRTLGDLFSGIALSIEHPFRLGEWIELNNGCQGQVIDINWRATRLRAWDNATFVIPNGELASQGFKNLHGSDHRFSPWYEIKVPAEVDPRFAKALLLDAALNCKRVLKKPLPVVRPDGCLHCSLHLHGLGSLSQLHVHVRRTGGAVSRDPSSLQESGRPAVADGAAIAYAGGRGDDGRTTYAPARLEGA